MNTCGTLCSGATNSNNCTSVSHSIPFHRFPAFCALLTSYMQTDLTFSCTCTSNNSAPALALYTQTMPTYICEQVYANCNILNAGVKAALDKCAADEKANCGHLNSTAFVETTSSSSSSSSSTPTSTSSPSGSATGAPTTTSSAGAAATMMAMGGQFGSGLLVAGAAAAFGYIL